MAVKKKLQKDLRICVLQRGWVLIGFYSKNGNYCYLENPYVIRRWGTQSGLGELALKGPNQNTILDKETETEFHECQVIRTIICNQKDWKQYYGD